MPASCTWTVPAIPAWIRQRNEYVPAFVKPSVKFYLTAILFVVFDIEAVLIYPWTVQFRYLGWSGLLTMASFLSLLVVALVYVWKKGALEWET